VYNYSLLAEIYQITRVLSALEAQYVNRSVSPSMPMHFKNTKYQS